MNPFLSCKPANIHMSSILYRVNIVTYYDGQNLSPKIGDGAVCMKLNSFITVWTYFTSFLLIMNCIKSPYPIDIATVGCNFARYTTHAMHPRSTKVPPHENCINILGASKTLHIPAVKNGSLRMGYISNSSNEQGLNPLDGRSSHVCSLGQYQIPSSAGWSKLFKHICKGNILFCNFNITS